MSLRDLVVCVFHDAPAGAPLGWAAAVMACLGDPPPKPFRFIAAVAATGVAPVLLLLLIAPGRLALAPVVSLFAAAAVAAVFPRPGEGAASGRPRASGRPSGRGRRHLRLVR